MGEKEVALPADAKKDQRLLPEQSSHPFGPLHLPQLPHSHLHLASEIPSAFSGTESPSFVPGIRHINPSQLLGKLSL